MTATKTRPARRLSNSKASTLVFDPTQMINLVEVWEDLLEQRKQLANRIWAIEHRTEASVPPSLTAYLDALHEQEASIQKAITSLWNTHPLAPWAKPIKGLGEHSIAVLVAHLGGDPYIAFPKSWGDDPEGKEKRVLFEEEPYERTIAQLRAYCGYGNPELRRQRGMGQDDALAMGNPNCKPRLRLIVESFIKYHARETHCRPTPYGEAYYVVKEAKYAGKLHESPCPQCHAKPGDPWRPGHIDAAAKRYVAKLFLKDLWIAAREVHLAEPA